MKAKLTLPSRRLSVINQEIDTEKKVEDVNIGTKCLVLKEETAENSPDITNKSKEEPGKLSNESGAVTLVNKVRRNPFTFPIPRWPGRKAAGRLWRKNSSKEETFPRTMHGS